MSQTVSLSPSSSLALRIAALDPDLPAPARPASARPVPARPERRSVTRLSVRAGLARYRNDRVGMLVDLGDANVDMAVSSIGPLRLFVVTEVERAREVLLEKHRSFRKGPAMSRYLGSLLGNGLLSAEGDEHRAQRKVLAPKFQPRQIAGHAQTMIALTESMLASWRGRESVDFDAEVTGLTIRIAARTMFGAAVSSDDIRVLADGMCVFQRWMLAQSTSIVPLPMSVPTPRNLRVRRAVRAMDTLVRRLIREHRDQGVQGDVLAAMLDARDENGVGMDDEIIRDQVMTLLLAGHETASSTLGWAYRALRELPEVAERIATEAAEVFGPQGAPVDRETVDARALVYTRAVLQELLRLRPSTYMIGRQAAEDVSIGGHRISAGSFVVVNTAGIHRRADYFEDPLAFRPERFLGSPTWPRSAYHPFGIGPRTCIGSHFAMLELTLALALICRAVRFEAPSEGIATPGYLPRAYEAEALITMRPVDRICFAPQWRAA